MLLFPNPSTMKDIYWDPKCNQKTGLYGTGILGPPHLFTTRDGEVHRVLRKALAGPPVWYKFEIRCFECLAYLCQPVDNWVFEK